MLQLMISTLFLRMGDGAQRDPPGTRKISSPPCYTNPYEEVGAAGPRRSVHPPGSIHAYSTLGRTGTVNSLALSKAFHTLLHLPEVCSRLGKLEYLGL